MKKPFMFHSDIYRENFLFLPAYTQKQVNNALKKLKATELIDISGCDGQTVFCADFVVIWSKHKDKSVESLSTLVHECVHAANMVLDHKGIPMNLENDESQAYLVEWLFENCLRALK
jgi:hypothetical protein